MKELAYISMLSVASRLNPLRRQHCFEIFGYDFIIDSDCCPWLIEVNTNPCLEESSPLLAMLIPRMLDDAFKLTLDVIFPSSEKLNQVRTILNDKHFCIAKYVTQTTK